MPAIFPTYLRDIGVSTNCSAKGRDSVLHSASNLPLAIHWSPEQTSKFHSAGVPKGASFKWLYQKRSGDRQKRAPAKGTAGAFPIQLQTPLWRGTTRAPLSWS